MMWEWMYQECSKMLRYYKLSAEDRDDIIQDTMISLFDSPEIAESIYNNRASSGLGLLRKQINYSVVAHSASKLFEDKRDYSAYIKVLDVCNKYNIYPLPENAFKIAPLMDGLPRYCTIATIESLLSSVKPTTMSLDALTEEGKTCV